MSVSHLKFILPVLLSIVGISGVHAAYVGKPELTDYNFANANVCEKVNLKIKFDHESMNSGNVFTVEMAVGGNFSTGPIVSMLGTLSQAGSAQNVFITVSFPATVLSGTNYRLRVKGSSPVTYSNQLNDFPFTVSKLGSADTDFYPEGYWKGYFYSWIPTTSEVITDGNTQDIFNPNNYLGYITEDTLSFDYNWGDAGLAPGNLPDTNHVCGSYKEFYSIRMRRKINFENGFYVFGGGGDDGFRLSIDGGVTWLVDLWSDHQFTGKMSNNACGTYITAGQKNVVVEYYENKTHSRFRMILKKTGDPAVNPISITYPADGTVICAQAAPFQMTSNPSGGFQWSGPGVSPGGTFNPAAAGTGFRTVNFETGFVAFGTNCLKTTAVTINVVPGFTASFTGLDTAYCPDVNFVNLVPQSPGGTFFGSGITGTSFNPSILNPGHYTIGYALNTGSGCGNDTIRKAVHIRTLPDAGFTGLPDSVCKGSGGIALVPNVAGALFSGSGVIPSNNQFIPSSLNSGTSYSITCQVTKNGCSNESIQSVFVLDKLKPTIAIHELKSVYCTSDPLFIPTSTPAGTYYLNGNQLVEINPTLLQPGEYELKAIYTPTTNVACTDTASAKLHFTVIANPKPDLGADFEVEAGMNITLDPKISTTYSWSSDNGAIQFEPNTVLIYSPENELTITVSSTDPTGTCVATDDVHIHVRPKMEIPNLFTPNGDATNQEWRIKGAYNNMSITIYDRWGKEVHKGVNDGDLAWDGKAGNKSDLFFYVIEHPTDGRKWTGWILTVE